MMEGEAGESEDTMEAGCVYNVFCRNMGAKGLRLKT